MLGWLRSSRREEATQVPETPGTQVGAFGKLPVQFEYVRHNTGRPEVRALDEWLRQGVALAARHPGDEGNRKGVAVHNGVFCASGQSPILFSVRPSADGSGRVYPFVVFAITPDIGASLPGQLPAEAAPFFASAPGIVRDAWDEQHLERLLARVDGLAQGAPGSPMDATGQPVDEFLMDLYGEIPQTEWLAHLTAVVELLREVDRRAPARVGWGLRLPIGAQAPMEGIAWWIGLARRVIGTRDWWPRVVWSHVPNGSSEALLFFREPPIAVATHLVQGHALREAVVDPGDYARARDDCQQLDPSLRTPLQLMDWLVR